MVTLTRAPLGVLDFHALLGGGGGVFERPSNSSPGPPSDKRQTAFESSSKIITKVLWSFLGQVTRGHRRSFFPIFRYFDFFLQSDVAREPEQLGGRGKSISVVTLVTVFGHLNGA